MSEKCGIGGTGGTGGVGRNIRNIRARLEQGRIGKCQKQQSKVGVEIWYMTRQS